ncbi:MAG: molybdate ABC transporter permease subunit [Pseudomonadota bacterium]
MPATALRRCREGLPVLSAAEAEALALSFQVAAVGVGAAFPFALALALLLARPPWPGRALLNALVHLPLVLPPVVMGYLLLIALGTRAPLGAWLDQTLGVRFVFSWQGAALASAVLTLPFQVRAMRLGFEGVDAGLLQAAETLGAGPLDRFFSVALPLALPGIVAGLITAFAAALGEFGAIITFVSNIPGETRTLPLAIYTAIQSPGGEAAAARLAALSIALALAGLGLAEWASARARRLVAP